MSAAWTALNDAVRTLVGQGAPRERLYGVYVSGSVGLREKDFPKEIHEAFRTFSAAIPRSQLQANCAKVKAGIDALSDSDSDVDLLISIVLEMYDAVSRYQPVRPRT